jgi:hypothetical protein
MDDRRVRFQESRWGQEISLLQVVQTGSGSYPMDTGGSFSGVKRQGYEADHSRPTSAKATPPYLFMA